MEVNLYNTYNMMIMVIIIIMMMIMIMIMMMMTIAVTQLGPNQGDFFSEESD